MKLNVRRTNQFLKLLALLIVLAALISLIWLNDAQRIVVGIGAGLGLINLLGLAYFFNKNTRPRR